MNEQIRDRRCKRCGCTEHTPCINHLGEACAWLTTDLCSGCVTQEEIECVEFLIVAGIAHEAASHVSDYTATERAEAARRYQLATGRGILEAARV